MQRTPQRRNHGFSLLELLLVVSIIGIIAAIAIPRLIESRRAAQESRAVATLRNIGSAQFAYASDAERFGTFAELIGSRVLADQFDRSGTGAGEIVSDGIYDFEMLFNTEFDTVTIDADPKDPTRYRFFRYRLGKGDASSPDGAIVILHAPATGGGSPGPSDYRVLGVVD